MNQRVEIIKEDNMIVILSELPLDKYNQITQIYYIFSLAKIYKNTKSTKMRNWINSQLLNFYREKYTNDITVILKVKEIIQILSLDQSLIEEILDDVPNLPLDPLFNK